MNISEITQVIMNVGFPIAMCCAMAWYVKDTSEKHREEVQQLNEEHNKEMQQITVALNNNTLALQRLCDKLEKEVA